MYIELKVGLGYFNLKLFRKKSTPRSFNLLSHGTIQCLIDHDSSEKHPNLHINGVTPFLKNYFSSVEINLLISLYIHLTYTYIVHRTLVLYRFSLSLKRL